MVGVGFRSACFRPKAVCVTTSDDYIFGRGVVDGKYLVVYENISTAELGV